MDERHIQIKFNNIILHSYNMLLKNRFYLIYLIIIVLLNSYSYVLDILNYKLNFYVNNLLFFITFFFHLFISFQILFHTKIIEENDNQESILKKRLFFKGFSKYIESNILMFLIILSFIIIISILIGLIFIILNQFKISISLKDKSTLKFAFIFIMFFSLGFSPKIILIPLVAVFDNKNSNYVSYNFQIVKGNYFFLLKIILFFIIPSSLIILPNILKIENFFYIKILKFIYYILATYFFQIPYTISQFLLYKKLNNNYLEYNAKTASNL